MTKKHQPKKKTTDDAGEILDRVIGDDGKLRREAENAKLNARIAEMIHDARTKAELTQKELAALVGTTQSVISRLEDADYEGHSLQMLARIAEVLDKRLELRLVSEAQR